MKKFISISLIVISLASLTGCSFGLDESKMAEYHDMEAINSYMESPLDADKYTESILFILSDDVRYSDYLNENSIKYKDTIGDSIISELGKRTSYISKEYEDPGDEGEPSIYDVNNLVGEDDRYPLYGACYSIEGYGTKEEAIQAIEDFNLQALNNITSLNVYRDMLVARVFNKYSGESLVRFKIVNCKLEDFKVFEGANKL